MARCGGVAEGALQAQPIIERQARDVTGPGQRVAWRPQSRGRTALDVAQPPAEGRRTLPLAEFIAGPRRTALRPGEMMTAILVPRPSAEGASRFLKLGARRYLVISIAMVAMRLDFQAGRVAHAAAAVGACGPVATRLPLVESALAGRPADPGLAEAITAEAVAPALSPIDDIRADAAYRVDAAVTLLRRAAAELAGGAA